VFMKPTAVHFPDPRRTNNFLDSCAFDPKYSPEHEAAKLIRSLGNEGKINLSLTHSNQKEINHPNTPAEVKHEAANMIYTIKTALTPEEESKKAKILMILTGNGSPDKYTADAAHVFEAGKYIGYFITTDKRILGKQGDLRQVTPAIILRPTEWLKVFNEAAEV